MLEAAQFSPEGTQMQDAHPSASPHRVQSRARKLTSVDRRTIIGKRIAELRDIYVTALNGLDAISPMKRLKVDEAAQLKALAEQARGDFMRDGKGSLDDIVRIERKAGAAERALGVVERPPARATGNPLADHFSRPPSREGRP